MLNFRMGSRHRFRDQVFWPEGGVICIEDQNTGNFVTITRAEAAARAIAFNGELPYITYPDERKELCDCVVALCEAVKEARSQGDPTDPEVTKDRVKSNRKVSLITGSDPRDALHKLRFSANNRDDNEIAGTVVDYSKQRHKALLSLGESDRFRKLRL